MGTETLRFGVAFGGDLEWIRQGCIDCCRNGSGRLGGAVEYLLGRKRKMTRRAQCHRAIQAGPQIV